MGKISIRTLAGMAAGALLLAAPASAAAAKRDPEKVPGRYIVVYKGSVDRPSTETSEREDKQGFKASKRYGRAIKGFAAPLSPGQVKKLQSDPEVAFVAPDRRAHATGALVSGDSSPLGVRRFGAATATTARDASGVNVAVIDTGIDLDHPDLNAASGVNCTGSGPADDDNGHGTHVAGTIGARNNGAGVVGVAPDTKLFAAKVLDSTGGGTWSQIICGIDWVTSTRTDSDASNDIAVANMSLGGPGQRVASCATTTDPMHKAICNSTAAGVTYVVAAGNDGWDFDYAQVPDVPAAYPQVLTVSAVSDGDGQPGGTGTAPTCTTGERDDRFATFSSFAATSAGAAHTVAAPGVCVNSTWPGGGYSAISGTSMASPHVAGSVALCINSAGTSGPCAGQAPADVVQRIRTDARNRTEGDSRYGFSGDPLRPASGRYYGYLAWGGTGWTRRPVKGYSPVTYTRVAGNVYNGLGASSRLNADDGSRVELSAVYSGGTYAAEIQPYTTITSAERTALRRLWVDYDGNVSAGSLSLRIYNFRRGVWETVDGPRTVPTTDRAFTWSNVAAPKDYVSSTGEIKVSVRATRSGGFLSRTDLVRFRLEL